jgi:signal transduction histidine kinase
VDLASCPEGAAADAALVEWRRKAANILLAASAAAFLPSGILFFLGYGPPIPSPVARSAELASYLVMIAAALLRRIEYRKRLFAYFIAAYVLVTYANLVHRGSVAEVGLVANPILVLVLCGSAAARIAILTSFAILVSTPFLRNLPGVARVLGVGPTQADPTDLVWFHAAVIAGFLVTLMILLDRFHLFLLDALAAERRATEKMQSEIQERRQLERDLARIADDERRHLGSEVHDGVCQQLTGALLRCQAMELRLDRGASASSAELGILSSLLGEAINEARAVAQGLCPLEPSPDALAPALRGLARRTHSLSGVPCEFMSAGDVRVEDPAVAQHLYRIAQEALSNAVRHAHASRIAVELRGSEDGLVLRVEDNGMGLAGTVPSSGMGLRTMAYRARILEGEYKIEAAPGGGTLISCRVPRSQAARNGGELHASVGGNRS